MATDPQTHAGEKMVTLWEATGRFLQQWALVKPVLDAQAAMSAVHGVNYQGPTIGNEIADLEKAHTAIADPYAGVQALREKEEHDHRAELAAAQTIPDAAGCIPASGSLEFVQAANVTLSNDNTTEMLRDVAALCAEHETALLRLGRRCEECGHYFSAWDIAKEDLGAWGHPCHQPNLPPGTPCESHRPRFIDPLALTPDERWDLGLPPTSALQARQERRDQEIAYQTQVLTEHGLLEEFGPLIGGALLSYLAEAVAASREQGWQPISTAPKGVHVFGWDGVKIVTMKHVGEWKEPWASVPGLFPVRPTHWRPLPSPPKETT